MRSKSKLQKQLNKRWYDRCVSSVMGRPDLFLLMPGSLVGFDVDCRGGHRDCGIVKLPDFVMPDFITPNASDYRLYLLSIKNVNADYHVYIDFLLPSGQDMRVTLDWVGKFRRFTKCTTLVDSYVNDIQFNPFFNCVSDGGIYSRIFACMDELMSLIDIPEFKCYKDYVYHTGFKFDNHYCFSF